MRICAGHKGACPTIKLAKVIGKKQSFKPLIGFSYLDKVNSQGHIHERFLGKSEQALIMSLNLCS